MSIVEVVRVLKELNLPADSLGLNTTSIQNGSNYIDYNKIKINVLSYGMNVFKENLY